MTTKLPPKDVVIIGLGWTGSILAQELTEAGLDVIAIESSKDAMQARGVTVVDQCFPSLDIAKVRLPSDAAAQPIQIGQDGGLPSPQARTRQLC